MLMLDVGRRKFNFGKYNDNNGHKDVPKKLEARNLLVDSSNAPGTSARANGSAGDLFLLPDWRHQSIGTFIKAGCCPLAGTLIVRLTCIRGILGGIFVVKAKSCIQCLLVKFFAITIVIFDEPEVGLVVVIGDCSKEKALVKSLSDPSADILIIGRSLGRLGRHVDIGSPLRRIFIGISAAISFDGRCFGNATRTGRLLPNILFLGIHARLLLLLLLFVITT